MTRRPALTMAVLVGVGAVVVVLAMRFSPGQGPRWDGRAPDMPQHPRLVLEDTIRGTVTDSDGQPVSGAKVVWATRRDENAEITGTTTSDSAGRFQLSGVRNLDRKGPAALAAILDGRFVAATARAVLPSNEGIQLKRNDRVTVHVPLIDNRRQPRVGVAVRPWIMLPEAGWIVWQPEKRFVTDRKGIATFTGLPENAFLRVEIVTPNLASPTAFERIAVRSKPVRNFGETVVWEGARISGRVVRPEGGSTAGRIVEAFRVQGTNGSGYARTLVDASGAYRLERLAPGEYIVRVQAPGNDPEMLASLPQVGIRVDEGDEAHLEPFSLVRGGRIIGRVRNGNEGLGLGGMHVLAAPMDAQGNVSRRVVETMSDREGAFSVCLPVGKYRLSGMYYAGDVFLAMRSRTEVYPDRITVTPGSSATIQILYSQMVMAPTGGRPALR